TETGTLNGGNTADFYFECSSVSLSKVFYLTYSSVELTFTGALDPTTAALTTSYSISAGTISSVDILDGQTVAINLAADLTKNTSYTFHANATLLATDLIPVNTNSIKELFLFPSITKAEMIDEQTVKIYFNKAMNILEAGDSWYYFVYAADWSSYSYGGLAVYDHEEFTTVLHLLFPLEMNRDDYYVEGWADYMYGDDVYIHDTKGYNLFQSGDIYAIFSTDINDLDLVYSYPSPATGAYITFANLVGEGTISIYTLSGVKIKEVEFTPASDQLQVTLENDSNNDLCSGVYLYRVETDAEGAEVKTGSFAIMK
ncbi:T9SS type A sorting domain-containing protein, partial [bacterium]|nr:T9SS type A sorting domain-containing protein [bacterium]